MGTPAFKVEQLKQDFTAVEYQYFDKLFHSWRHEGGGTGFGEYFFNLFMQIEEELIKTMQRDHADKDVAADRDWTAPSKD